MKFRKPIRFIPLALFSTLLLFSCSEHKEVSEQEYTVRQSPVAFHMSFDNLDYFDEEFIELSGMLTRDDRKIEFLDGRFGLAIRMNHIPEPVDATNMTGIDLDLVTAAIFNTRRGDIDMGYTQPMLWGSGRLNTRLGAVAFWAKGDVLFQGPLFEQTSIAFGRTERDLLGVIVDEENRLGAYLRDARYRRHTLDSGIEWDGSEWNHVVLNWDWANGLELWLNGEVVASNWGEGGWFETAPPGLFHLPAPGIKFDELYLMDRPLNRTEIERLMEDNSPPSEESPYYVRPDGDYSPERIRTYSGLHRNEGLPTATPAAGLSLTEVFPEFVGDGNIPGWYMIDGRNEMAWPHPYAIFTVIPGDVDFHAKKADIRLPAGAKVNYMTLTGNLTNVEVLAGNGSMESAEPLFSVPDDHGFFFGQMFETTEGGTFRIPFTEEFGTPSVYSFEGAIYRIPFSELYGSPSEFMGGVNLPVSGVKRIQNVGLYHVKEQPVGSVQPEGSIYRIAGPAELKLDRRGQFKIHAATSRDERRFAVAGSQAGGDSGDIEIGGFSRLNIVTEPYREETGLTSVTLSLPLRTERQEETLYLRVRDPALPVRLWNEFALNLNGFDGDFERLELVIDFQDLVLASGDRLWVDIATAGPAEVRLGDDSAPAELHLREVEIWMAIDQWADKQMIPARAQYTHMYEYMPWQFSHRTVNLEDPYAFGGPFDMILPAQAVNRIHPDHEHAGFMLKMTGPNYRSGHPVDPGSFDRITLPNPHGAPEWALYLHDYNQKRHAIAEWYRSIQNSDGQVGGGWNDDTLLMRGLTDVLYDGNHMAQQLNDAIHTGMEFTDLYRDGYCNIHPMDPLHISDFIAERYKTMIYNLGQPHAAEREMESAWRLGKPDKTPVNYADGYPFHNSVNVFHWYWGENVPEEPYEAKPLDEIAADLRLYASVLDRDYFFRMTEAFIHSDNIVPYGSRDLYPILLGGPHPQARQARPELAVKWPSGGGPEVARVVRYADDRSLELLTWSFDDRRRDLQMRLMRLEAGHYRISIHEDSRGNGQAGRELWSKERDLKRFDVISLPIPSRQGVVIRVEQLEHHDRSAQLADLAVNPWGAEFQGGGVSVRVHNLGNASAEAIRVLLYDGETVVGEQVIERLEAPTDFVARNTSVRFSGVEWSPHLNVVVDPDDDIDEILKENNRSRVVNDVDAEFLAVFPTGEEPPYRRSPLSFECTCID